MRIGELSKFTGVSIATIRLYEREGLISVADRTEGRMRVFTEVQKTRLEFIKRVRNLGFSLDDVKMLLAFSGGVAAVEVESLDAIFAGIKSRRRDLELLESRLSSVALGHTDCVNLRPIACAGKPIGCSSL